MAKRKNKKDYNSTVLIASGKSTFYDYEGTRTSERKRDWLRRMTQDRKRK